MYGAPVPPTIAILRPQSALPYPHPVRPGLLLLSALALATLIGCASDDTSVVDRFALRGRVTDIRDGSSVGGARVRFLSDALDPSEATTNDDGRYEMTVVVAEGIDFGTLRVDRSGYLPSPALSVYFDGTERRIDVELEPEPSEDDEEE